MENLTELRVTEMSYPTKVVFGPGALARLADQARRLKMTKPLVVSDPGVSRAGLVDRARRGLAQAGSAGHLFCPVRADPTQEGGIERPRAFPACGLYG